MKNELISKVTIVSIDEKFGDVGKIFFKSNEELNKEIAKYRCPIRLSMFLDEIGIEELFIADNARVDFHHDLSKESDKISENVIAGKYYYDDYLEKTKHLNKYGV